MASKRQTTMAKLQRERNVKERRERKLEKRAAVAAAKAEGVAGLAQTDDVSDELALADVDVAEVDAAS